MGLHWTGPTGQLEPRTPLRVDFPVDCWLRGLLPGFPAQSPARQQHGDQERMAGTGRAPGYPEPPQVLR